MSNLLGDMGSGNMTNGDGGGDGTSSSDTSSEHIDIRPTVLGVTWTLTIVSLLFLGARCWVKRTTQRGLYADDYVLLAAAGTLVAFAGTTTWGTANDLGVSHEEAHTTATDEKINRLQLILVVATTLSVLGAAWSKTAFAITLLRVTKGLLKQFLWFIIVSMNVILAFNALLQYIRCRPAEAMWLKEAIGTCWPRDVVVYYSIAAAGYSAAMDVILACIPWGIVMKLKMHTKEKIGVAVCMSLGLVAAMTSIVRACYIPTIYQDDHTLNEANLFIWTAAELAVTIIAASIPVLRPLVVHVVRRDRRGTNATTAEYQNTFRTGTYMCTAVSRSQNYLKMDGKGGGGGSGGGSLGRNSSKSKTTMGTTQHSDVDLKYGRGDEAEDSGSEGGLVVGPADATKYDLGRNMETKGTFHGGIIKTEEITIDYDRQSRVHGKIDTFERRAILGFEMEDISPTIAKR